MIDLVCNLVFLWHCMRASEHLLEVGAEKSSGSLREYFLHHLEEERGHADWLAEDLATAGVTAARTKLPREAMEMVGSMYYLVLHVDPCALLGYMRVLESWPLDSVLEQLVAKHPPELLRTIRYHAEHDPAHLDDLKAQIARLTPQQRALVDQTSGITIEYLTRAVETLRKAA